MHTRGAGLVARSLKVRGEEIYIIILVLIFFCPKAHKRTIRISPYLIRSVADADIEVWKISFDHITQ